MLSASLVLGMFACKGDGGSSSDCVDGVCSEDGLFDPGFNAPQDGACGEAKVTFERRIPYVMLLVDQSGSMTQDFGNGDRWNVLRDALLDASTGIVKKLESEVRFGLALYTSHNGTSGGQCPILASVGAEFGNYDAIRDVYDAAKPDDDTPTGESIREVAKQLQKIYLNVPTPKVIVLATDGEPDTCANPDPQNGQQESIDAAQEAYGMGIETYVISVGDEVGDKHLQDMANAGTGLAVDGPQNAKFWKALDNGQLYDAFDTIVNGVRDCVFILDGNVVAGYEDQGTVLLDGQSLTKDDPDGWKLTGSNQVSLQGAACETIQDGDHELTIDFPCGGYEAPPIK
jgi:hypothetical protein